MTTELYKLWRPVAFKEVFGQEVAVAQIKALLPAFPHTTLITGPSGCGKTTAARIIADKLGCPPITDAGGPHPGFKEVNAASSRGIDTIREIEAEMPMGTIGGSVRVYVLDECHQLLSPAQSALLKMLEDTPKHVYFFLCTTDPGKLLPTIKTRCTEIKMVAMTPAALLKTLEDVAAKAKITSSTALLAKIVEAASGSARKALVLLNQVAGIKGEAEQLAAVSGDAVQRAAFDLVRLLLWESATWAKASELLKALKEQDVEIEPLRWALLSCAMGELLKGEKRAGWANLIIEEFSRPFFDNKWPGVASAVWNVLQVRVKR